MFMPIKIHSFSDLLQFITQLDKPPSLAMFGNLMASEIQTKCRNDFIIDFFLELQQCDLHVQEVSYDVIVGTGID